MIVREEAYRNIHRNDPALSRGLFRGIDVFVKLHRLGLKPEDLAHVMAMMEEYASAASCAALITHKGKKAPKEIARLRSEYTKRWSRKESLNHI